MVFSFRIFLVFLLFVTAAYSGDSDDEGERAVFYRKILITKRISIEKTLESPARKNSEAYQQTADIIRGIQDTPDIKITFKKSTKKGFEGFDELEVDTGLPGFYIGLKKREEEKPYLLYLRAYFRSRGDIPATVEFNFDKKEMDFLKTAGLEEAQGIIKAFVVVNKQKLSCYLIDSERERIREFAPFIFKLIENKDMPFEVEEGIY